MYWKGILLDLIHSGPGGGQGWNAIRKGILPDLIHSGFGEAGV